ncbi:hypothetical protein [Burkholderia sp. Ax-1719]|uniref:hypothetical protein n=1 Tax=Burkholderia sp. Ax-1719 TaxID=2608334 RepID=UPI001420FCEF|nr:hypothetical protein [Burkholderia sp. Ax-1719]NIE64113.1 hypothetical protein [Burkholderia sp. Ax-1719]
MSVPTFAELNNVALDGLEFCRRVYDVFERIREADEGKIRLRMRTTTAEKRLIEELLPICKFVQTRYRPGRYISVRWVEGNQPFDAELEQRGDYVDMGYFPPRTYLEVTYAVHANDYLCRELLTQKGVVFSPDGVKRLKTREIVSEPVGYSGTDYAASFSEVVLRRISQKIEKNYPHGTILVIACSLGNLCFQDDWDALVRNVKDKLPEHSFGEIFLYDTALEHTASL